jgi:hypothetical protein
LAWTPASCSRQSAASQACSSPRHAASPKPIAVKLHVTAGIWPRAHV